MLFRIFSHFLRHFYNCSRAKTPAGKRGKGNANRISPIATRSTSGAQSADQIIQNYPGPKVNVTSSSAPVVSQVSVAASSSSAPLLVTPSTSSQSPPLLGLGSAMPSTGISASEAANLQGFLQSQLDNFKQQMIASLQMKMTPPSPAPPAVSANRLAAARPPGNFVPPAAPARPAPSASASSAPTSSAMGPSASAVPAAVLANPFVGTSTWSPFSFAPVSSVPAAASFYPAQPGNTGQEDEEVEEMIDKVLAAHELSVNPSAIHPPPQVTSEVMGGRHLVQDCDVDTLRESKIISLQSSMTSPDKKRLARYLSVLQYAFADIRAVLARSAMMFPFRDIEVLARASDRQQVRDLWRRDQELVNTSLNAMEEKLRGLTAHLHLANDKALNPYGFATIDRMEKMAVMEKVATKSELESFKQALAAQDKASTAAKRKRTRPAKNQNGRNKKNKPNHNNQPDLARCKACNKLGHVEGDARCKAAPKST